VQTLRHPLTITIIGFLLSGIIGVSFTNWLNSTAKSRELEAALHRRAVNAVIELADLMHERRTRAVLVASAIYRGSSIKEVEARKWSYDDVYVRWNTKLPGILLGIRDQVFKKFGLDEFEDYISALTHQGNLGHTLPDSSAIWQVGYLTLMDSCITDAFDAYVSGKLTSSAILDNCHFNFLNTGVLKCSTTMLDSLHKIINTQDASNTTPQTDALSIREDCDPLSPPS